MEAARQLQQKLKNVVVELDDRDEYTPGWKFNEWEMKGVPIRIELGPKDLAKKQAVVVRRDTGKKEFVKVSQIEDVVGKTLESMQQSMLKAATDMLQRSIVTVKSLKDIEQAVKNQKLPKAPFCGSKKCEEKLQAKTEAKSLCIDLESKQGKCVVCGEKGLQAYFGKSY